MKYRLAVPDDIPSIKELCEDEGLAFPLLQMCFVAQDENTKKIVAFVNVANFPTIDTMVSTNKIAAMRLFDMAIGGISANGGKYVKCWTLRDDVVNVAVKSGFYINDKQATILTKEL